MKFKILSANEFCKLKHRKHQIIEMIEDATKCVKAKNFDSASWRIQLATKWLEAKNKSAKQRNSN